MRVFFLIFLIFFSCEAQTQEGFSKEKKEAINVIKELNSSCLNKSDNINKFFTEFVQCVVCETNNNYENEFLIENSKFVQDNFKEVFAFLKYESINNSQITFIKQDSIFILSYETAKPNKEKGFEGSSALISFKKENGKLKIFGIQTIP